MEEKQVNEIKELRLKLGVTQAKLSKELGVPLKTWVNWEQGLRQPVPWAKRLLIKEIRRMIDEQKTK